MVETGIRSTSRLSALSWRIVLSLGITRQKLGLGPIWPKATEILAKAAHSYNIPTWCTAVVPAIWLPRLRVKSFAAWLEAQDREAGFFDHEVICAWKPLALPAASSDSGSHWRFSNIGSSTPARQRPRGRRRLSELRGADRN